MREQTIKRSAVPLLLALLVPVLAACGGAAPAEPQVIRETVVVVETAAPIRETVVVVETAAPAATAEPAEPTDTSFTTPHPILGDLRVRQAIAYCTNRPELIKSVYGFLSDEQQQTLLMDTFLPQGHWALAPQESLTTYPFDPVKGNALLTEAGWLGEPGAVRANEAGSPLFLEFTTTNAQFRQTWASVLEQQLLNNCGIQISRKHAPASWWFGDTTGLSRRDFELGAFAWVGQIDPGGVSLYACNQIPFPSNNWEGQNSMGWCNEAASKAIIAANNTLNREERIEQYAIVQQEFTKDMVSLPLFNRLEAAAATNNLENFRPDSTEYVTANAAEWKLKDGGTSLVMGFTQEPASLFGLVESAAVTAMIGEFLGQGATSYSYDYQPVLLKSLPTIDNGEATNTEVEVKAGDKVWSTSGEAVELAPGVEVATSTGETVVYESGTLKMNQLTTNFSWIDGITWQDGEPLKQADMELAYAIDCNPDSGATSLVVCNSFQSVDVTSDTAYSITYLPGAQWPEYFAIGIGAYPSHLVLSDGRKLADVPAAEWATLPEIAEKPLSMGPYVIDSWEKGQRMVLKANPNYVKGEPAVKEITIKFIADSQQAVSQLLTGDVDILDATTLGAGAEVETVLKAAAEGKVQATVVASATWEHVDFNLFVR